MKRINFIFIALFLLLSSAQLWAQEQKPYQPAATFKRDTLRYLEYNYTIRQQQYIGKTVGEILKELEYPVLYVEGTAAMGSDGPSRMSDLILGIRQIGKEPSELKDGYIRIWFANPPTLDEYNEASDFSLNNRFPTLSQKLYNFIKDLKVSGISSNLYNVQDSVIKENQRRSMEKLLEEGKAGREKYEAAKRARYAREAEEMRKQSSPEQ